MYPGEFVGWGVYPTEFTGASVVCPKEDLPDSILAELDSIITLPEYLRTMQSDITEDNAENGNPDSDNNDGGWDWESLIYEHSTSPSPPNLYGATANGLYQAYQIVPNIETFTSMKDAADYIVAAGPANIRSAADQVYLLNFASLPEVTNPSYYTDGARAMWQYRLDNYGGTATSFAEGLRDYRGTTGWPNGIIPWDLAPYVESLMVMESLFPGNNYGTDAAEIVEVIYQDSFNGSPGYFEPHGHNKGWDATWSNNDYWFYSAGVAGIIRAFETSGMYLSEIPALEAVMLECQYDSGAFSYQYGAETSIDDADWQCTAYATMCLYENLDKTPDNLAALYSAGVWMESTMNPGGGFVYSDGTHLPEIGGECAAALSYVLKTTAGIYPTFDGASPVMCGVTKTATIAYDVQDNTPGLFGYEIAVEITGPVTVGIDDFTDLYGMDYFQVLDLGDGVFSVTGTLFGAQPGILTDVDLFSVETVTGGDGIVMLTIPGCNLRDPENTPFMAIFGMAGFDVDCTAPDPVTDIVAMPGHNKIGVSWTHDGTDVDHYEVFSGLWHDGAYASIYPEYDDVANAIPTRPADYAAVLDNDEEWADLGDFAALTTTQTWDPAARGVYYYEVFAVDAAGNASPAAAANDRATNYWLGDVNGDGVVDAIGDITPLGACFGTADPDGLYNAYCDVGRTDDWSRLGIPLTDSTIDFEDLMVFSMNFSVVSATKDRAPLSKIVDLAWVTLDDGRQALRLLDGTGVKGLRVRAAVPVISVNAGDLISEQIQPTFMKNVGELLDVSVAVMGSNEGLRGTGDLLVLELADGVDASDLSISVRGTDNSKLDYRMDMLSGTSAPRVFSLSANYPNPFNPSTKITFALPEGHNVRLAVYDLEGRLVRTLISEPREAGTHTTIWNGRDEDNQFVSSGTYFFRVEAGPYSQSRKMTLLK
jgi:flagellar hook capping protein FlgD